jgi:hypothetical protein
MDERMCIPNRDRFAGGVVAQDRIEFGRRLGGVHKCSEKKRI